MSKFRYILLGLILVSFFFVFSSFAQTTTPDVQAIIKQLQDQIELLNQQILDLQSRLEKTEQEVEVVKAEIKLTRSLRKGESGDDVRQLQEFLKQFPDVYPEGIVTGFFGSLTELAVKRFQEKNGIESIGIVGPKTLQKLNEFSVSATPAVSAIPAVPAIPGVSTAIPAIPAIPASPALPLQPASSSQPIVIPATPAIPAIPAVPGVSTAIPAVPAIPASPASGSATKTPTPTPTSTTTTIVFSNQVVTGLSTSSAKITFTTNVPTLAKIVYNLQGLASSTLWEPPNTGNPPYTYITSHTFQVSNLQRNSIYYFAVFVTSSDGQEANWPNMSFQALAVSTPEPTPTSTPTPLPASNKPATVTIEGADGTWCYDSDRNDNQKIKGSCQDNTGTYYDFCGGGTVYEYVCRGSSSSTVSCAGGAEIGKNYICSDLFGSSYTCSNGACVNILTPTPTPSPQANSCTDSDGGNDIYTKGTVTVSFTSGPSLTEYEFCASSTDVKERYCDKGTLLYNTVDSRCYFGCVDGACLRTPVSTSSVSFSPPNLSQISLMANILNALSSILQTLSNLLQ